MARYDRSFHAFAALFFFSLANNALAQNVPAAGASAEVTTTAPVPGTQPNEDVAGTPVTVHDDGPSSASASGISDFEGFDTAEGSAAAIVGSTVRSRSAVDAAGGTANPYEAVSRARWVTQFTSIGSDPNGVIDVDLTVLIDGVLSMFDNNSGAGADDVFAGVDLVLNAYTAGGMVSVFDGGARVANIARNSSALSRSGDWADSSRDADFTGQGCGGSSCDYDVDATIALMDGFFVDFGAVFALELELTTSAYAYAGREITALSNFFDTASASLGTDTAGVQFAVVPVPVPAALPLLASALLLLGLLGRRLS